MSESKNSNQQETPITQSSLRTARLLIAVYAGLSILSVVAMAILSGVAPKQTTKEAWIHSIIIAATSILLLLFASKTRSGNARALLRVRIVTAILLPALVLVLVFLPIPLWLKLEHVVDIVLLLLVARIIFRNQSS